MINALKSLALMAAAAVLVAGADAQVLGKRPPGGQQPAQQPAQQAAPQTEAEGALGHVALTNGFSDDPYSAQILAGGGTDAAQAFGNGCVGMVAQAPDFTLDYQAGSLTLHISDISDGDTSLVVRAPDGSVHCSDDADNSLNPAVAFDSPQSGRYQVWVGAIGGGFVQSTLYVSELGSAQALASAGLLDLPSSGGSAQGVASGGGAPTTTEPFITLSTGFSPDPYTIGTQAGGPMSVNQTFNECQGWIPDQGNVQLTYTAGSLPLFFSVTSSVDTTLFIQAPDQKLYCDDDSGETANSPMIKFEQPQSGVYTIWIGAYTQGQTSPATLHISELHGE